MMPDEFYKIAMMIYNQGMECDAAARILRERFPDFVEEIKQVVRVRVESYNPRKEKPIIVY